MRTDFKMKKNFIYLLYNGSRDGAVVRTLASHHCGPGSIPGLDFIYGLSLLLVFVPAQRFFPGTPVTLPTQKPTFRNSNLTWKQWMEEPPR